jgi:hypothetical protein
MKGDMCLTYNKVGWGSFHLKKNTNYGPRSICFDNLRADWRVSL